MTTFRTCAQCLRTLDDAMFKVCTIDGNISRLDGKPRPCLHCVHCRLFPMWCRTCFNRRMGSELHPQELEEIRVLVQESAKIYPQRMELA